MDTDFSLGPRGWRTFNSKRTRRVSEFAALVSTGRIRTSENWRVEAKFLSEINVLASIPEVRSSTHIEGVHCVVPSSQEYLTAEDRRYRDDFARQSWSVISILLLCEVLAT